MRNVHPLVLLLALLASGPAGPAGAIVGTIDNVPAATLLLPYFEVDLRDAQGVNTLFSVNNSAAAAVLAKVVVWSDQGIPVLNFNLYLTGYDVQTISLRDVLVDGRLPLTAPAGDFPSCTNMPFPSESISSSFRAHLQAWLTGFESPETHNCAGSKDWETGNIAWGYLNLQHSGLEAYADDAAQSWVIAVMEAAGRYSVGYDVLQLDNANDSAEPIPSF